MGQKLREGRRNGGGRTSSLSQGPEARAWSNCQVQCLAGRGRDPVEGTDFSIPCTNLGVHKWDFFTLKPTWRTTFGSF